MNNTEDDLLLLKSKFAAAKQLANNGNYQRAIDAFESFVHLDRFEARARRQIVECLMRQQNWKEAAFHVQKIFEITKPNNRDMKRWLDIYLHFGAASRPVDPFPNYLRNLEKSSPLKSGNFHIFTAALPKTGSTSLSISLASAANASKINFLVVPPSSTEWGIPYWRAVDILEGKFLINHCHLGPSIETLNGMKKRNWMKVIVHFRNPVETMASTIDLFIRQRSKNLLSGAPELWCADDNEIRRWTFDNYLPRMANWMHNWYDLYEAKHESIFGLSTMDEMRTDGQDALALRVLKNLDCELDYNSKTEPQRQGVRLTGARKIELTTNEKHMIRTSFRPGFLEFFGW